MNHFNLSCKDLMQRLFSVSVTSRESQSVLHQASQMVCFKGRFGESIAMFISLVTHTFYYWGLTARTTGHLVHWNWDCILGMGEIMFTMEFSLWLLLNPQPNKNPLVAHSSVFEVWLVTKFVIAQGCSSMRHLFPPIHGSFYTLDTYIAHFHIKSISDKFLHTSSKHWNCKAGTVFLSMREDGLGFSLMQQLKL